MKKVIEAQMTGRCAICLKPYKVGTKIVKTDKGWAEASCYKPDDLTPNLSIEGLNNMLKMAQSMCGGSNELAAAYLNGLLQVNQQAFSIKMANRISQQNEKKLKAWDREYKDYSDDVNPDKE